MTKIKYIVEYKRVGDREWRFYFGFSGTDYNRLGEKYDEAREIAGVAEVRIRKKIEQCEVVEEWKKETANENRS